MELTFQSHPFPYLQCLMQETHFQEETADTIIPDSYPDIDHIADCFADVVLRGKECRMGTAIISGGIKAGILYVPDTSASIQCLDVYIPFTICFAYLYYHTDIDKYLIAYRFFFLDRLPT